MKLALQIFTVLPIADVCVADESQLVSMGTLDGGRIQVINDVLFVRTTFSPRADANARPFTVTSHIFQMRETEKGTLFIVRTAPHLPRGSNPPTNDFEGRYLTADFSSEKARVKFTKEPTDQSYWNVDRRDVKQAEYERFEGKRIRPPPSGALRTKNDKGDWMYLNVDTTPFLFSERTVAGTLTCYAFTLAPEPITRFQFEIFKPRDGL